MPDSDVDYAYQCGLEKGRKEREAEIEAAFREGAEAAREDIFAVVDNYPCLSSEFYEVADEFLSIDALWAEYKKGGES